MFNEKLLTKREAILRVDPAQLEQLLHKRIDPQADVKPVAKGLPASPGAATGKVVFSADEAEELGNKGEIIILVREETKPDDIHGFISAQGVLTSRGGKTSHAAVVARSMGKPCVSGCSAIKINDRKKIFQVNDRIIKEREIITIDGTSGEVFIGEVPLIEPQITEDFKQVLHWADEMRALEVRANADSPNDAKIARDFGAEGIGLCRTERMFNDVDRLPIFQKMILSENEEERKLAIEKLMPLQKKDFIEIFEVMEGLPVTIRLLDPPLHEFLPSIEQLMVDINELREQGKDVTEKRNVLRKVKTLYEVNPMLGHRGVRLGITIPELYDMQINAILEAACEVTKKNIDVKPEIMIPQVSMASELKIVKRRLESIAHRVFRKYHQEIDYKFGTMMEVVRGCLTAEQIAKFAEFFSFGTNDLTQGTFSFSREDAENKFLPKYMEDSILKFNPFETLDIDGVGRLMQIAIQDGKKSRATLKIGICGEHGGDPGSVRFCSQIGLNYVSCSGYRVPVARLAAAQEIAKRKR
jgi:pyruvate,orthophosphate dikinase